MRKPLTRKLISNTIGDPLVVNYVHNAIHATKSVPSVRVRRHLSRVDLLADLRDAAGLNTRDDDELELLLARWRSRWPTPPCPLSPRTDPVGLNLQTLAALFNLDELDVRLLELALEHDTNAQLQDLASSLQQAVGKKQHTVVAALLGQRRDAISSALTEKSRLRAIGLVEHSMHDDLGFELSDHLKTVFERSEVLDLERLRALLFPVGRDPSLTAADFAHLTDGHMVVEVVRRSLAAKRRGVNVLLHGPPGTGKTEFARILGHACGVPLAVVELEDAEKSRGTARLERLRTTLRAAPATGGLVLFDEFEDLFQSTFFGLGPLEPRMSKQWFNELLETTPVPIIWTSNRVHGIDPAFLRRFTCSLEFKHLGPHQRANVLSRQLAESPLPDADVQSLARRYSSSPAQFQTAIDTARLLDDGRVSRETVERALRPIEQLVTGKDPLAIASFDPSTFRESVLNISTPVDALINAAKRWEPSAGGLAMCFSGPPGTGKTELAHYLASVMNRPLVRRTPSDILDKYVGSTEQNISAAFSEAREEGAVLLFDEVDSLLRDRRGAERSWEVTQVNEFLQQLETYRGVVVCTTNLFDNLDPAAMRRFPLKVRFGWLRLEQATELFQSALGPLVPTASRAEIEDALRPLDRLAPGDFAALARRARWTNQSWSVVALAAELGFEINTRREAPAIGFR